LCLVLIALALAISPSSTRVQSPIVVVVTELGSITIEVDTAHAPITAANFLKYVDAGLYDGGEFHRTVRPDTEVRADAPIQVVQARIDQNRKDQGFSPIPLERTTLTGLKHLNGTVSMARDVTPTAPGPDTATSGFFICLGDQPVLNFNGGRSQDGQGFRCLRPSHRRNGRRQDDSDVECTARDAGNKLGCHGSDASAANQDLAGVP
jgi:peptidyl-prolyl cis-trans isomerase A (cyclophilin A)